MSNVGVCWNGHITNLIILGESSDESKEFLSLLLGSGRPAVLKAAKEVVKLLRLEVPGQLGQQVVHVLHYGFVLADLWWWCGVVVEWWWNGGTLTQAHKGPPPPPEPPRSCRGR